MHTLVFRTTVILASALAVCSGDLTPLSSAPRRASDPAAEAPGAGSALSADGVVGGNSVSGISAISVIRGHVEIRQQLPPIEPRPSVGDLSAPPRRSVDRRRSVVYLEVAPRPAFDERDDFRARMDQRNQTFVPHLLAITAGTMVDFPNNDPTYHNVFSLSRPKPFDLGRYAAGHSKSVRFDRPGIVRVFCEIHSHMSAFILVFGHRFFAVTDEQGNYRIDGVPPGTYTVTAWNEALPQQSGQVVVPEGGGEVDVNFALGTATR